MKGAILAMLLVIVVAEDASSQFDRNHPFWSLKARDENRWLLEKALTRKKYWSDNHKRAVKAAKDGLWGIAVDEYEATVRSIILGFRNNSDPLDAADLQQAHKAALESPVLNSLRFDLAIAYTNRADELYSFGRTHEADSLAELSVFFLEHVKVYAFDPWSAGVSFATIAAAFSRLGKHEQAVQYYRAALMLIEPLARTADPLQAVVNVRLGQQYLVINREYEAEPPLLRGTEFADSSAAGSKESRSWCLQLAAEGRAFLGEACRRMNRGKEAESLYAESIRIALDSDQPLVLFNCRPLYDNFAHMLREQGDHVRADSVNLWCDRLQRRAELWIRDGGSQNRK